MRKEEFLYDLPSEIKNGLRNCRSSICIDEECGIIRVAFPYFAYARIEYAYVDSDTIVENVIAVQMDGRYNINIAAEMLATAEVNYNIENHEIGTTSIDAVCREICEDVRGFREQLSNKRAEWEDRLNLVFLAFERDFARNSAANYRSAIFHIVKHLPLCLVRRHIADDERAAFASLDSDRAGACSAALEVFLREVKQV